MRYCFVLLVIAIFWGLVGCASATPQVDAYYQGNALTFEALKIPLQHQIDNVPYFEQSTGHCGPATLAMLMSWAGKSIDMETLAPQVYTSGLKGSFQADMMSAARRQGLIAIPVVGLNVLLREIAAGNPVIVFENLSVSWWPQWHYAVVYGYDLEKQIVIMHSGLEREKHWDLRRFERSWKLGDYWGLLVLPPTRLSATADDFEHMKAASHLEQLDFKSDAETSYRKILMRWPDSLSANMGLANIVFAKKNFSEAVQLLKQATEKHAQSAMAWHNLSLAYGAIHQFHKARKSAQIALALASAGDKDAYQKSLKKYLR